MKNENEARSPVSKSILINRAKTHQQLATANFLAIHAHSRATHLPPIYPQFSPTPTESLLARFTRGAKLHENGGWMRIPVLSHNRKRSSSDTSDKAIHEIDEDPPPLVSRTCGNNALSSSSSSSSARGPCRRYRVNPSPLSDNRWNPPVKFQFLSFQNLMDEFLECI